jgi:PD-(D/E)XK nuclease superfamily
MELDVRRPNQVVPDYSLTGDLLSFSRCELQYRYYNGSSLPPSRPVQLWYGEFIHGTMESAFRRWEASNGMLPFPWPYTPLAEAGPFEPPPDGLPEHDIRMLGWPIEQTLAQEGKQARSRRARRAAYRRAERAINMLGPHLFPLISTAEQRVLGTRPLALEGARSTRYALRGVIDVLGNVQMGKPGANAIIEAIRAIQPNLAGDFKIIVDYKGARRPWLRDDQHWWLGDWQVQTYAWLRERQPEARPVAAGILIYVNELSPSSADVGLIRNEINRGLTDVVPLPGSPDQYQIQAWVPGANANISDSFKLDRALRVIPVTEESKVEATGRFDEMVARIEQNVAREALRASIAQGWSPTCDDRNTCSACDFLSFCPRPAEGADPGAPVDDDEFA